MQRIWVRDQQSRTFPEKWDFSNVEDGADLCFANGMVGLPSDLPEENKKLIGVIIRGWDFAMHSEDFQGTLLATCRRLEDAGFNVQIFAFCVPVDRQAIDYFEKQGFRVAAWNPDQTHASDYLAALSACAFFLSARFHGIVIGVLLGRPSIGICLDPKVRQLCEKLGLGEFVWDSPFESAQLLSLATTMNTQREALVQRLATNRRSEGVVADKMMSDALSLLFEKA